MAKVFQFDDFILDYNAYELRRNSVLVPVEPLVLDLLTLLMVNGKAGRGGRPRCFDGPALERAQRV